MEWIKVEDGLPEVPTSKGETDVDVIVYADGLVLDNSLFDIALGFHSYCILLDDIDQIPNVTHWMYLPEPPKEESNVSRSSFEWYYWAWR